MKLKKLELIGFKSFADKTVFEFEETLTGLVGPNGSGKSNVVDALKWVLGERSAQKLRGNEMADMIFNGSSARRALGSAEVRLTLENDDGSLPTDYEEVCITRRCYRSGESDYFLNDEACRLKDIRALFMDTGVGVSAYSFIEQGQVDLLLQASSSERREVLEEAAGINRYLDQKKTAERKLERVKGNLQRVTDIIEELDRQLRSVRRQARKARRFKRYKDELSGLRFGLAVHKRRELIREQNELKSEKQDRDERCRALTEEAESIRQKLAEAEELLEHVRGEVSETDDKLSRLGARQYSMGKEIEINENRRQELQERREELAERLQEAESDIERVQKELQQTNEKLQSGQEKLEARRSECERLENSMRKQGQECEELEDRIDRDKKTVFNLLHQDSQLQSEISMLEAEIETLENRLQRQNSREKDLEKRCEDIDEKRLIAKKELEDVSGELQQLNRQIEIVQNELERETGEMETLTDRITELKADIRGKLSRRQVLEDLQARAEGIGSGVQVLLEEIENEDSEFYGAPGMLANLLEVSTKDALAVEAALGSRVEAIILDSRDQARLGLRTLREGQKGRAEVLALESIDKREEPRCSLDGAEALIDLLQFPSRIAPAVEKLLGNSFVVDDTETALQLVENGLPEGVKLVTRSGDCFEPSGVWSAGEPETGSLISRRSELAELDEEIAELNRRLDDLSEEGERRSQRIQQFQKRRSNLVARKEKVSGTESELRNKHSILTSKSEQRNEELGLIRSEAESLCEQIAGSKKRARTAREERSQLQRKSERKQEELEKLQVNAREQREERQSVTEQLNAVRSEIGRIEEQLNSRRAMARRLQGELSQRQNERERIGRQQDSSLQQQHQAEEKIQEAKKTRAELEHQKEELEAVLEQKSRKAEETAREISDLKERVEEVRRKQNKADQAVQELQLKESEVNLRLDSLAERTAEECGIHLEAVELEPEQWRETPLFTEAEIEEFYEAEPEAPGEKVAQWYAQAKQENSEEEKQEDQGPRVVPLEEAVELRDEALAMADSDETNWDEVAERTDELRKKVERMGGANLDAIREQDELETRAEFLKQQKEDLEKARRHELEIIRELSTKSRESFRETFEAVRQNFQVLIRKLFGGGNGDLILDYGEEEEEDILEAGIEIKVRPPGKENRSISLLSGGEKALSAVALLFAIFESKPSPFCLLDEVDAPLDEANVGRFLSMLDEYRDDTQFVIVTHNKRTMSAAETLYGISMRENGVSNKLAVNFEELDRRLEQMKRESEQAGVRAKAG